MRILHVCYEFPPIGGGGGVALEHITRHLSDRYKMAVLTTATGMSGKRSRHHDVDLIKLPVLGRRNLYATSALVVSSYLIGVLVSFRLLFSRRTVDYVHSHFTIPSGIVGLVVARLLRRPHILTVYAGDIFASDSEDPSVRHNLLNRCAGYVSRFIIKRSARVFTISEDSANTVRTYLSLPDQKMDVIPLGVESERVEPFSRQELGINEEAVVIVSMCRLVERKQILHVIEALAQCSIKEWVFVIGGDGPQRTLLERRAHELGIARQCRFLGRVSEETKFRYLSAGDVFVMVSQHEGFGISYLEAMHCGVSVIAGNNGGQTEFLVHGTNALLVDPSEPQELRDALNKLGTDSELRESMGCANRQAVKRFYWEHIAKQYDDVYQEVIRKTGVEDE